MNIDLNIRMKQFRKRRGYTQAQMARACGVSIDELAGFAPESTVDPELERMISAMDKREQKKLAAMIKIAKHK